MTIAGISSRAAEMANVNALLNGLLIAYSVTDLYLLPGNCGHHLRNRAPDRESNHNRRRHTTGLGCRRH
jgi:hypothetical protein